MDKRRKAERDGRRAEWIATWWLRCKGFRLLAKRLRTPHGEIDLVMRRGGLLIFIEVKARRSFAEAEEALHPRGLARMRAAAQMVMPRFDTIIHFKKSALNHRFDAVLIAPGRFPRHIPMITTD
jgi:putative endonuclease